MSWLSGLLGVVAEPVKSVVTGWQKRVTQRQENKLAIEKAKAEAKIARMRAKAEHAQEWETKSVENAGWKDEWILILWSFPAILAFLGKAQVVADGFAVLADTPDWYQTSWGVMVASAYGIRKVWRHFGSGGKSK